MSFFVIILAIFLVFYGRECNGNVNDSELQLYFDSDEYVKFSNPQAFSLLIEDAAKNSLNASFFNDLEAIKTASKNNFKFEQKYVAFKGIENIDFTGNCRVLWLCPQSFFTENNKMTILDIYNKFRNDKIGARSKVTKLYWFWKLEEASQKEANKCPEHKFEKSQKLVVRIGDIMEQKSYQNKFDDDEYYPQRLYEILRCTKYGNNLVQKTDSQNEFVQKLPDLLNENFFGDLDSKNELKRTNVTYLGCGYTLRWIHEDQTFVAYIVCYTCNHQKIAPPSKFCPSFAMGSDPKYPYLCAEESLQNDYIGDIITKTKRCPKEYSLVIQPAMDAAEVPILINGTESEDEEFCNRTRIIFLLYLLQLLTMLSFLVNIFLIGPRPLSGPKPKPPPPPPGTAKTTTTPIPEMDLDIKHKRRVKKKKSQYFYF